MHAASSPIRQPENHHTTAKLKPPHPIKQTPHRRQRQQYTRDIQRAQFFFKHARAHQRTQRNHAHIHARKHQRGVAAECAVGFEVEQNIHKIQAAQHDTADDAGARPTGFLRHQIRRHQHACQRKHHQQIAARARRFGKLFKQNINHAVAQPHAE